LLKRRVLLVSTLPVFIKKKPLGRALIDQNYCALLLKKKECRKEEKRTNKNTHKSCLFAQWGGVSPRQTAAITGYTYQHVLRVWRQGKEKVKEKINKEAERGQQDIEMFLQHEK
ncbi:MAG: hypothetical protein J6P29_02765, partial [Acetobacter sp.]|nr:hypothetical protein [Acetobacter sp.]